MNAIRSFFDIEELKQAFKKENAAKKMDGISV